MAVTYINNVTSWQYPDYRYYGLSTDNKPTAVPENSMFTELDTGLEYYFSDGVWELVGGSVVDGSIQLSTLSVTANGRYNAGSGAAYRAVNVNVPNPSTGTLSITQNGTVNVAQYANVSVNVPDASKADIIKMVERTTSINSLPDEITQIGNYAFSNYTALALTTLPASVTNIGAFSFRNCSNLALTALPNGVTTVGAQAFYGCPSIAIAAIPAAVTSIGERAFYGCDGLTSLRFTNKNIAISDNVFSGCPNLTDIYVSWSEGEVANAPWGAVNATIHYDWTGD